MTKMYCDICGQEMNANTSNDKYCIKINPLITVGGAKQIDREWKEICCKCALEVTSYIDSMSSVYFALNKIKQSS